MAQERLATETARVSPFTKFYLGRLVDKVSTERPVPLPVTESEVVGALILAAHQVPLEAVKAAVERYRDREAELAEAVGGFLRSNSP
jgi:hypothetical protein